MPRLQWLLQAEGRTLSTRNADRLKQNFFSLGSLLVECGVLPEDEIANWLNAPQNEGIAASDSLKEDFAESKCRATLTAAIAQFNDRFLKLPPNDPEAVKALLEETNEVLLSQVENIASLSASKQLPYWWEDFIYVPFYRAEPYGRSGAIKPVESRSLATAVRETTWLEIYQQTRRSFAEKFLCAAKGDREYLDRVYGKDRDRDSALEELFEEFKSVMLKIYQERPENYVPQMMALSEVGSRKSEVGSVGQPAADEDDSELSAFDKSSLVLQSSGKEQQLSEDNAEGDSKLPTSDFRLPTSDEETFETLDIVVEVSAAETSKTGKNNIRPFSGVLFRIDEPSDVAPAKGPGVPLYVSRPVAQKLLEQIVQSKALPLDVHESLSQHSDEDVTGVMTGAEIQGNEFIVHGHLFPWSQQKRVELIASKQKELGMSMNANALGYLTEIDGKSVYNITDLDLLGANILYSRNATYKKTRLIAASSVNFNQEESMDIEKHFEDIQKTISQIGDRMSSEIEEIKAQQAKQGQELREIVSERESQQTAIAAQQSHEEKQKERDELVQLVTASVLKGINPKGQPPRLTNTIPLAAMDGVKGEEKSLNALQVELISAQARLDTLAEHGIANKDRIGLIDRINQLKLQMMQSN